MKTSWRTPVVILVCAIVVLLLSFGIRTSLGLFLKPITFDLGLGREAFAFALALQNLVWGAAQPFAGAVADRYGAGRVVSIAGALYVLGLFLMSGSSTALDLSVSAGILTGLALCGTGFPILLAVVGRSVSSDRRSLFLGLASAGGSSGQLIIAPAGQALLDSLGWSNALLALAALSMIMVPLAAAFVGKGLVPQQEVEQSITEAIREAAKDKSYWLLTTGFFVCGYHVSFIGAHLPAFVSDAGIDPKYGAIALAIIGFGNIIGSLICGYLGGRMPKRIVLSGLYLLRAFVISMFIYVPITTESVLVFSFCMGLLWLGTVPLTSGLVAHIYGVRYMAMLFGFVFFSHQLGSFLGVWMGGRLYDATGSYDAVWWTAIALGILSAIIHLPINERPVTRLSAAATR